MPEDFVGWLHVVSRLSTPLWRPLGTFRGVRGKVRGRSRVVVGALCDSVGLTKTPRALGEPDMARSYAGAALVEGASNV